MSEDNAGACYLSTQEYSCEICGMAGLSDDLMREHTRTHHVEGSAQCPFCGFSGVVPAELLLHVNQAHLDYLTPENELMSFIDDQSPSIDGDSDSIDCKTPQKTHLMPPPTPQQVQQARLKQRSNGAISKAHSLGSSNSNGVANRNHHINGKIQSSSSSNPKQKLNGKSASCDMNGGGSGSRSSSSSSTNGMDHASTSTSNGQGSPSRSQLGLKLSKANTPSVKKQSPLQCPLCPYTSDNATVLEEHINRSHFDPLSPGVNKSSSTTSNNHFSTLNALQCPICTRVFDSATDLELHVNIEHRDILSPGKPNTNSNTFQIGSSGSICPVCSISLEKMKTQEMEMHIESH